MKALQSKLIYKSLLQAYWLTATVRGLRHWNFRLLSSWWRIIRNNEWKVLMRPCLLLSMYVTEQWWRQLVLCELSSFILDWVMGQFIVRLKLFSNGNCPQIGMQFQSSIPGVINPRLTSRLRSLPGVKRNFWLPAMCTCTESYSTYQKRWENWEA